MKYLSKQLTIVMILMLNLNCSAQSHQNLEISLNGTWDIIFDDANEGVQNKWYLDEKFEQHPNSKNIQVPSCWEQTEKDYEGAAIYRTKFNIPTNWKDKVIELHFEAVNYKSEIWLNDQVVGFHEGGYTPFNFRVDKLAKLGEENTLIVRVISPIILTDKYIDGLGRQEVPMWRGAITGGIWQSVSIVAKGAVGLKDVFIEPKIDTNTATFNIEIENTKTTIKSAEVLVNILSEDGKEVASKVEPIEVLPGKNNMTWDLPIKDAIYWDTENPYLYKADVSIKINGETSDQWEAKFGMREFTVKNDEFYLNGKPLYLKAAFFEGLYPVGLAYPDSKEMAKKEIRLAKEAGFNMIRPWRKPAPPMWLDLCDEMGVLTVGSLVVECMHRPISSPRLPFVVENELRKTILSNRNRTCIVQWELFNEINRPILAQMLNSMSVLARELDPTRMILDESGGWGEGANIYLPFERTPTKFNDIHHYSGSQIDQKEFDGYLATAKTKEDLVKSGLEGVKSYGKNVVPGMMTYISELGYGSTPNLGENIKEFEAKGNPIVAPTIYHKAIHEGTIATLKKLDFDKIYPNVEDFYLEQQKMHGIANKRMIEATRLNNTIKGYCVHALVGGDWVLGAGLLDLWRNPKTLVYSMTQEANQKQTTPIRILPRNVYAETGTKLEIHGVNELADENVSVSIKIISENKEVVYNENVQKVYKNGISNLYSTKLNTSNLNGNYTVHVEVKNQSGEIIVSNNQSFDVFSKERMPIPKSKIAVVDPEGTLTKFLKINKIDFIPFNNEIDKDIPVFIGKALKNNEQYKNRVRNVVAFVKSGGYAINLEVIGNMVPGFDRELKEVEKSALPFNSEIQGDWATLGGWAARSHVVTEHPIFNDLPTNLIMHGAYENVHPVNSMLKIEGTYIAGLVGYDHYPNNDDMRRHYNGTGDVWWAADVLEVPFDKGEMIYSTLRIVENLGKDPVADKILFNMIAYASSKE
ncbi:MAG: glycoside hydrolase family 2 TIM barrel-domain containing protein [Algibacter sp.]|uniref:glycoside hydrolase family 2 protein n=1 Tax=Algibacter sp. TaxID=1872428 RepID=UPI002630DE10|nr:sugar-binding domain-containing protein [Algibacter sp.]MDG1731239.1 glycoside hydrolase family 2 TIM barrel-domain containing protein [Algibacter sp.]MDG2178820.1 glycoside hydrolase family 2 TIM barrel-domain containing protein [Algibacter sp.]